MGELYDKVAASDRGIADRWKLRTREDKARRLVPADVDYIFGPVFAGRGKLKPAHGEATVALLEVVPMTREAIVRIRKYISDADYAGRFNLIPLTTEAELLHINRALSHDIVGKIIFKSPGTLISYMPTDYLAIRELIAQKRISVFEAKTGGMTFISLLKGYYKERTNELVLFEFVDPVVRHGFIVHEMTHAIQDWKDASISSDLFAEADAFIAQAIAVHTMTGTYSTDANEKIHADAAKLVIENKAQPSSTEWQSAYSAVIEIVKKFYDAKGPRTYTEPINESEMYMRVFSRLDVSEMLRESLKRSEEELRRSMRDIDLSKYVPKR
jgi:hypothetical protein